MLISRRDIVAGAASVCAAFGVDRPLAFIDAAVAEGSDAPFRKHQLGEYEVYSLVDGMFNVPLREGFIRNANVEQIKTALREDGLPDANVPIPFTAMAIKTHDRLVLIDTGTGGAPIYGPRSGQLRQSMAAAGLDPKAVDTILISHLHGDHIYGLMDKDNTQVFPNAEIVVPAAELAWWTRQEVDSMDLGPTRKGLSQRIRATIATWKNVRPVDGEAQLVPGIRALPAPGHSPGHTVHLLTSGSRTLLISADTAWLPALFVRHPEWQVALDQDGPLAALTRKRIFDMAVADKLIVAGTHWLLPNVGTLAKDGGGYAFVPLSS